MLFPHELFTVSKEYQKNVETKCSMHNMSYMNSGLRPSFFYSWEAQLQMYDESIL